MRNDIFSRPHISSQSVLSIAHIDLKDKKNHREWEKNKNLNNLWNWRRERDSNSWCNFLHTAFPGLHLKPLGHLYICEKHHFSHFCHKWQKFRFTFVFRIFATRRNSHSIGELVATYNLIFFLDALACLSLGCSSSPKLASIFWDPAYFFSLFETIEFNIFCLLFPLLDKSHLRCKAQQIGLR